MIQTSNACTHKSQENGCIGVGRQLPKGERHLLDDMNPEHGKCVNCVNVGKPSQILEIYIQFVPWNKKNKKNCSLKTSHVHQCKLTYCCCYGDLVSEMIDYSVFNSNYSAPRRKPHIVTNHQNLAVLLLLPPDFVSMDSRRKLLFIHRLILLGRKDDNYRWTKIHSFSISLQFSTTRLSQLRSAKHTANKS